MNEKAPTRKQRLNLDSRKSDSTKKPHKLPTSKNDRKILRQIARKWASRGYYSTPSEAMQALLKGVESWN